MGGRPAVLNTELVRVAQGEPNFGQLLYSRAGGVLGLVVLLKVDKVALVARGVQRRCRRICTIALRVPRKS